MGIFDFFRKSKSAPETHSFDPEAHHKVLVYLRHLWSGEEPDEIFEQKSLSRDLGFNSLSLAELIFSLSREREIPNERIVDFLRTGIVDGGDQKLANLLERVAILADTFEESERIVLLSSGAVGDMEEIAPIDSAFDTVGHIVKYCKAIESLKKLQDHDAIDAEYGWVDEDPGWK